MQWEKTSGCVFLLIPPGFSQKCLLYWSVSPGPKKLIIKSPQSDLILWREILRPVVEVQAWMEGLSWLLMRQMSTPRGYPEIRPKMVAKGLKIGNFPMDPTLGSCIIDNSVPKTEITITITINNKVIAIVINGHCEYLHALASLAFKLSVSTISTVTTS